MPSTCGHEVNGAIVGEWNAAGLSQGFLGYPLTDETVTPDGIGRYNHFQNGSIYWTAITGAHEVHGAIRDRWATLGWERSILGYPVSDETDEIDGSGRVSLFEHGAIHWKRADGSITVQSDANMLLGPQQGNTDRPGADIANFVPPAANPYDVRNGLHRKCFMQGLDLCRAEYHAGAAATLLDQERYSTATGKQLLHIWDQSGRSTTQHVFDAWRR